MAEQEKEGLTRITSRDSTLRDLVYVLFRHKWAMAVAFVLCVGMAFVYNKTAPEVYRSEAQVFVKVANLQKDPGLDPARALPLALSSDAEVNAEVSLLTTQETLRRVVAKLGPEVILNPTSESAGGEVVGEIVEPGLLQRVGGGVSSGIARARTAVVGKKRPLPREDLAIRTLASSLRADSPRDNNSIFVSLSSTDPYQAQRLLGEVLAEYRKHSIEMRRTEAPRHFFEEQSGNRKTALETAETDLAEFRAKHNISSLEQQKALLLTRVGDYKASISESKTDLSAASAAVAALKTSIGSEDREVVMSTATSSNQLVEEWRTQLLDLQGQEKDMAMGYKDNHKPLINLRERIADLQAQIDKLSDTSVAVTRGPNPKRIELERKLGEESAAMVASQARVGQLTDDLTKAEDELAALGRNEAEFGRLMRERELAENEYRAQQDKVKASERQDEMERANIGSVSIVQPATLNLRPIRPRKSLNLLLSMIFGTCAGVALAFALEYVNQSIKTTEDVERQLGLPVLATVSAKEFKKCI